MTDLYTKIGNCLGAYPELKSISSEALHHRAEVLESMIKQRTNNQFPYGFPVEIVDGAIRLILYDVKMQDKVGIKSESLSRHSVTYDTGEFVAGYPVNMLDFMKPYMKARF